MRCPTIFVFVARCSDTPDHFLTSLLFILVVHFGYYYFWLFIVLIACPLPFELFLLLFRFLLFFYLFYFLLLFGILLFLLPDYSYCSVVACYCWSTVALRFVVFICALYYLHICFCELLLFFKFKAVAKSVVFFVVLQRYSHRSFDTCLKFLVNY